MMKSLYKFTSVFIFAIVFLFFGCNLGFDTAYYMQANRDDVSKEEVGIIEDGEIEPEDFGDDEEGNGDVAEETEEVTNADGSVTTKKTTTKTVTNPDGSTSVIVTLVETTTYPDGSRDVTTTITETKTPGEFNPFYSAEPGNNWNDPNYKFEASKVDDFFLKVVFGSGNIPAYTFYPGRGFKSGAYTVTNTPLSGSPSISKVNVKFYSAPDGENKVTDPMNVNITDATFHRFDGRNPLRKPADKTEQANTGRFRFWHFNGDASVQKLDQYLCVVDTYSKFLWAYVKITGTGETAGQKVPVKFDAMENYEANAGATRGTKRMFWEYDPIGYVDEKGNVTLYTEYKNDMTSQGAVNFFPQIHNATRQLATQNGAGGAGRSPYYWAETPSWFEKGEETTTVTTIGPIHYEPGQEIDDSALGGGTTDEIPEGSKFPGFAAGKDFADRPREKYSYRTKHTGTWQTVNVEAGWGTVLNEWVFGFDGDELTFTSVDEKIGESSKKTETYKFVKDANEKGEAAIFKDSKGKEINVAITPLGLIVDSQLVARAGFSDPGADFILRVRGALYQKSVTVDGARKTVVYQFSEDGGTVTTKNMTGAANPLGNSKPVPGGWFSGDGEYYFVKERVADGVTVKTSGLYRWYDGSIALWYQKPYYGLDLQGDGYTQIRRTRASNDQDPWGTNLVKDAFSAESEIGLRNNASILDDEATNTQKFLGNVSNTVYQLRPQVPYSYKTKLDSTSKQLVERKVTGNGTVLNEWTFSEDGKTLTLNKNDTVLKTSEQGDVYTFDETQDELVNDYQARYIASNGEKVTISYRNGELKKNSELLGTDSYNDLGPDFILRVRGMMFKKVIDNGKKTVSFIFSRDGGSVTVKNMNGGLAAFKGDGTYYFHHEYGNGERKDRAVYEFTGGSVTLIDFNGSPHYGLVLEEDDTKIWRTTGGANGVAPTWDGAYGSEVCERTSDPISPDQKAVYISIRAKSFKNVNMVSKNAGVFWDSSEKTAYLIHVLRSSVFSTGEEAKYDVLSKTFNEFDEYGGGTAVGAADNINPGDTRQLSTAKIDYPAIPVDDDKNIFVKLDTRFYLYAVRLGFIDAAITDPIKVSDYDTPAVVLKYNKQTECLEFLDSENGKPTGTAGWSIKAGQTKDITLGFAKTTEKWYVQGATGNAQAKAEATFEISFDVQ